MRWTSNRLPAPFTRSQIVRSACSLVLGAALLLTGGHPAAAEILDPCVVRSETTISSSEYPIRIGVDATGRIYELTNESADGGPNVPWTYAVRRYTPTGGADTGYGTVRFGAVGNNPGMVVAGDGTVTLSSFESDNRPAIRYQRIDPNGHLSTIRSVGRAGHYVSGVGAFDAGEHLLSGIVVAPNDGSAAVALVFDVDSGEIITETPVSLVGDITAVSPKAFALEDGSVSIAGRAPVQLPIPSTHHRPRITDLLDTDGAVIAVGSADVAVTGPLVSPTRPMFARFALDNPTTPNPFSIGDESRAFTGISANGVAVLEEPEALAWVTGQPRPLRDTDLVGIDLATGERSAVASIDGGRSVGGRALPGLAVRVDGSMRIVSQADEGGLFVFDLWSDSPAPPQPAALTGQVERLYRAYFDRAPEPPGMLYWRTQRAKGSPIAAVSNAFAESPEFISTYGSLDNSQFVELVYRNVLDRSPDSAGRSFWVAQLGAGTTRGAVMTGFSDSAEFVAASATAATHLDSEGQVARLYRAYFERDPDTGGFCYWTGQIERSGVDAVSAEFARSREFTETYGPVTDDQFVGLVYRNVLSRSPDAAGRTFWIDQLATGASRGRVMTAFSESPEYLLQTDTLPASP